MCTVKLVYSISVDLYIPLVSEWKKTSILFQECTVLILQIVYSTPYN